MVCDSLTTHCTRSGVLASIRGQYEARAAGPAKEAVLAAFLAERVPTLYAEVADRVQAQVVATVRASARELAERNRAIAAAEGREAAAAQLAESHRKQ